VRQLIPIILIPIQAGILEWGWRSELPSVGARRIGEITGAIAIGTAAMSTLTTITILIVTILAVAIARAAEDRVDREELEDQADLAVLEGSVVQVNLEGSVVQAESVDLAVLVESVELVAESGNTIHRIAVTHRMAIVGRRISLDKPTIVLAPVRALVLVRVVARARAQDPPLVRLAERAAPRVVPVAVPKRPHRVLPVEIKWAIVRHRKRIMETAAVHMVAGAAEITRAPAVIVAVAVWAAVGTVAAAAVVVAAGTAEAEAAAAADAAEEDAVVAEEVDAKQFDEEKTDENKNQ
jgi:hypothetical protein